MMDIFIIIVCFVVGITLAYLTHQILIPKKHKTFAIISAFIIGVFLIWFVDFTLPIGKGGVRDSADATPQILMIFLFAFRFYLLGIMLFGFVLKNKKSS